MMTKKIGGRPQKYSGEDPVRLTVSIRPRYKKMIDDLAAYRATSMSEVVELAVAKLAKDTVVEVGVLNDTKTIFDIYVTFESLVTSIYQSSWIMNDEDAKQRSHSQLLQYHASIINKPKALIKPLDDFIYDAISTLLSYSIMPNEKALEECINLKSRDEANPEKIIQKPEMAFSLFLNFEDIVEIIGEQWREGGTKEEIVTIIFDVLKLLRTGKVKPMSNDKKNSYYEWKLLMSYIENKEIAPIAAF